MDIDKTITKALGKSQNDVFLPYHLGHIIYKQLKKNSTALPQTNHYEALIKNLTHSGILNPINKLNAYTLLGGKPLETNQLACQLDPFCYLSHFSAMDYHGLTNRLPTTLYITTPNDSDWRTSAHSLMKKELHESYDEYLNQSFPHLTKQKFKELNTQPVHQFNASHQGAFIKPQGRNLRISSIGRTFLDMIRTPDLCGGIHHVIDAYEEHAEIYLQAVIDEVNQHGTAIDKVRVGYILEERCGLSDSQISSWEQYAQRGGSRKLDASADFEPRWSEKWKISLNT